MASLVRLGIVSQGCSAQLLEQCLACVRRFRYNSTVGYLRLGRCARM
jgi:hypothetical protein